MTHRSKSHENEVLHVLLALSGKNHILLDLEVDLLTLKMTVNHENNIRNGFSSQNYTKKKVLHLFLLLFVKKSYFTFKLPLNFDLAFCPLAPQPSLIFNSARMLL